MEKYIKEIVRIYKRRTKAHDILLNCDIALDKLIKLLLKGKKNGK